MYYMDVDGSYISKDIFLEKQKYVKGKPSYLNIYFESDSSFINMLHPKKKYGKLTPAENLVLRRYLDSINSIPIAKSKFILIRWYPGEDGCNKTATSSRIYYYNKRFRNKLDRVNDTKIFWMYNDSTGLKYRDIRKNKWHLDHKNIVESLFFKYRFKCSSYVIIATNGNYICLYGESRKDSAFELTKELRETID